MANSVRSRKNGASRAGTKHATSSMGSIAPGAPSTRKTLSFIGAILFGASIAFWLVGNIKLSEVKWSSPSTPDEEWQDRREQVKDAFVSSWDAYTKYAWGESALIGSKLHQKLICTIRSRSLSPDLQKRLTDES